MREHFQVRRPIPRFKRADAIVEQIRRWIATKDLRPGDRLPQERQLIELFHSSRGTVREALKVLESQGLVEVLPGAKGGARIASVSYDHTSQFLRNYLYFQSLTWSQIYRVRERLEPMLAVTVVNHLTEEDFSALRQTIESCRLGIAGEIDPREHRAAELEFHAILCRACPDPLLQLLCNFISDLLRDFVEYRNVIEPRDSEFGRAALRYHSELLAAYEEGDRAQVERLMTEHIHHAGTLIGEKEFLVDAGVLLLGGG
jgi:DNA-binding FadR family transcriptional regulator